MGAGPQQAPVYAAILTPKGKFLHDVFIYPHPELQDAVLLDVDRDGRTAALQLLNRYKLRRPIKFQDVSARYSVATCWGRASPPPGPWWRPDPRLADLGFRALVPAAAAATLGDAVGASAAAASEDEYRALRYQLGVAEGEVEIPAGQAAPLDYNVDVLNGVSYTKGCYVGQERNSFTHYRGVIRKRLMPVRLEVLGPGDSPASQPAARQLGSGTDGDTAGPGPSSDSAAAGTAAAQAVCGAGADVVDAASGRSVGQLRGAVLAGSGAGPQGRGGAAAWGIAYLKLDAALHAAEGRSELLVAASSGAEAAGSAEELGTTAARTAAAGAETGIVGGGAGGLSPGAAVWRVIPVRPTWWPSEWGREEEVASGGGSR
ncbi:hypothetical protein PLESTF_001272000 [Pleodorina starrii]|nr:hypothetical protein PLESTF_001272000 [Pleodorina starrii]